VRMFWIIFLAMAIFTIHNQANAAKSCAMEQGTWTCSDDRTGQQTYGEWENGEYRERSDEE
jgi:hypothetical protein